MRKPIVIFTIGTHGDVRPCVALGRGLQQAGYPVRIATSENFASLVRGAGLDFSPLTADFQAMLEADRGIADQGLNLRAMARIFREKYAAWAANWVEEGRAASEGAGLLIGVSNSTLLAKALSEALRIPFAIARLQPLTPSRIMPPMVLSGSGRNLEAVLNLGAHYLLFQLVWGVMRPAINGIVRPQLGLRRYPRSGPYLFRRELHRAKVINGFSSEIVERPVDWPESSQVTGYWFLDEPEWSPSEELRTFLAAGSQPIYVGFGSMVTGDAAEFTRTIVDAIRKSGQRAIVSTGWGGLQGFCDEDKKQIFFLKSAPHDQLLPLVAAAVHHGGAGTTAAAARAGIPSVIVPFYGDQPFWAKRLARRGVAPPAVNRKSLTAETLAAAIIASLMPEMVRRAAAMGKSIRAEDGIGEAIRWLRRWELLPRDEECGRHGSASLDDLKAKEASVP